MHPTLERLEVPGSGDVWWGGGGVLVRWGDGDILLGAGGGE